MDSNWKERKYFVHVYDKKNVCYLKMHSHGDDSKCVEKNETIE